MGPETFLEKWAKRIQGAWWVLAGRWVAMPPECLERDLWDLRSMKPACEHAWRAGPPEYHGDHKVIPVRCLFCSEYMEVLERKP